MKNKTYSFIAIAIIMFFVACSNEEILIDPKPNSSSKTENIVTFEVSIPQNGLFTRIGLEQRDDKSIVLTWEDDDQLQLVVVQGEVKAKSVVTVKNISEGRDKAEFDVALPDESTGFNKAETFDVYGVYGGAGLDDTNPTNLTLPISAGSAISLEDVKERKDMVLYFQSKDIDASNIQVTARFKHLGSLFSINLKNTSSASLDNLTEARLIGVNGDLNWGYNTDGGGKTYDLVSGEFQDASSGGNYISFKAEKNSLPSGESITFWGWYPPIPNKKWPELKLELRDASSVIATSIDSKPAKNTAPIAGKSYYFFAELDDSGLTINKEYYSVHVENMGALGSLLSDKKGNIENLVVTGKLNKADFDVMKDEMPNLKYVNLKNASCENDKIPDSALDGNESITTFIFPTNVKTIGNMAFKKSVLAGTLELPKGLNTIGDEAFHTCSNLSGDLFIPSEVTSIGKMAFWMCKNITGSLTLPEGLTTISNSTFTNCFLTGTLELPDGITAIEDQAFWGAKFTGVLKLPANLETIGVGAFKALSGITGVEFGDKLVDIGKEAFVSSGISGKVVFPTNLETIGESAFSGLTKITGVEFGNNLITIAPRTFLNAVGISGKVVFPTNLETIGESAFQGCSGITGVEFGDKLETIGKQVFYKCPDIVGEVVFPLSLDLLDNFAFYSSNKVDAYVFPRTVPITYTSTMIPNGSTIKVPAEAVATYEATEKWKDLTIIGY